MTIIFQSTIYQILNDLSNRPNIICINNGLRIPSIKFSLARAVAKGRACLPDKQALINSEGCNLCCIT